MKKFFMLLLVVLAAIILIKPQEVNAATVVDDDYRNLNILDFSQLYVEGGKLKTHQTFELHQGEVVTFIATTSFFGSAYDATTNTLTTGTEMNLTYTVANEKDQGFIYHLPYKYYNPGIMAAQQSVACDGTMQINDFLSRISSVDYIDKNHVMMYKGGLIDFKGFVNEVSEPDIEYVDSDTLVIHTDCQAPISVADLKNSIYAYDYVDGIITGNQMQVLTDTYTSNKSVGDHVMEFKASDRSGNTRVLRVIISVEDSEPPVISIATPIKFEICGRLATIEDIRNNFEIVDNNDGIIPVSKLYGFNWLGVSFDGSTIRRYTFEIFCDDSNGNTGRLVGSFESVDTTPPSIKLKQMSVLLSDYYDGFLKLTPRDFFEYVRDFSNGSFTYYFDTTFSDEGGSIGDVTVVARVVDCNGNVAETTGVFHLIDDIAPMFYVKSEAIRADAANPLSIREVHSRIQQDLDEKGITYDQVIMVDSNYFDNATEPGVYEVKYAYKCGDDINYQYCEIEVLSTLEAPTEDTVEKQPYVPIENKLDTNVDNNQDKNFNPIWYLVALVPIVLFTIVYVVSRRKHQVIK